MKAIVVHAFGAPDVMKLEDVADLPPGQGEAIVRVRAAGVNPYDTYMRAGTYGANNPSLPFTPGGDVAGVVESCGPGVKDFKTGDRVFSAGPSIGGYAQFARYKCSELLPLPENVSFAQGAGVFVPYATAYRALFQIGRAKPGETVLVHGASGGVGIAAVQFARAAGIRTIGTAGSDNGLELVKREGADIVVNHRLPDYQRRILAETNEHGVDVILEMLANVNLGNDLKMLGRGGRVAVVGSRGDVQITPRDLMAREASVTGVMIRNASESESGEINAAIAAGLRNGALRPQVAAELPLAAAHEAHRRIIEGDHQGKIVLIP